MALPISRNTTYAPGTQVKAADLNDIQDGIIGAGHTEITSQIGAINCFASGGAPTQYATRWETTTVNDVVSYPVTLHAGDRITSVKAFVHENSGNAILVAISEYDGTDEATNILDSGSSPGSGTFQQVTLNGGSLPYTIEADHQVWVNVGDAVGGTIGRKYYHIEVTYDRP